MRKLVTFVSALGFIMVLGAAFVAIDGFATDERRAAFDAGVNELAAGNDGMGVAERRRDIVGRTARVIRTFKQGLFFSAPVELTSMLPPAPEGWVARGYVASDGIAITGEVPTESLNPAKTTSLLRAFEQSAEKTGKMSAHATYARGERLVALRLVSDLDTFRRLKSPASAEAAKALSAPGRPAGVTPLATMDGIAVFGESRFSTDAAGRPMPVAYRHFTFNIGHVVFGEIITNAADADLAAILSGLNVAALQDALPRPTQHYAAGEGLRYLAGEEPSGEPPEPTPAFRAYAMLDAEGLEDRERHALIAIAQGRFSDWPGLKAASGGFYPVTDRLVSVLGPQPTHMRAGREAAVLLAERSGELSEAETQVLDWIARAQAGTQADLHQLPAWSADLGGDVKDIVALLPVE